jgi:MFS transporter, PPP family, 3-phenylpropionic acid transporter
VKKIWPFSFYFLYYAALAYFAPFIVLFYQQNQFNGPQIALLTGLPPLITLFAAPFWTNVADSKRWHRQVMSLGILVAILCVLLLQNMSIFLITLLTVIVLFFFFSPVASLSDSATIAMLGADKAMYGRVRIGGTIGWGLFALIAGSMINSYGLKLAFWGFAFFSLINLFVAQKLVYDDSTVHESLNGGGVQFFLTSRRWQLFLVSSFLGGLGASSVASFLAPYMTGLGATESQVGFAIMIATLTELPIFFFGNRLLKRFAAQNLFLFALLMMGIRSLFYALVKTIPAVYIVQAFGGMIFPAMWLAGVAYADEHAPAGLKSTAQGLFGAMSFGFGAAVGGFLGGLLLESVGGRGMYLVFSFIILGGLVVIELLKRILPDEKVAQSTS